METASGYSSEYVRHNLDGSAISTYVLVMLIVPLKLWCRLTGGMSNLGWDAALAIASLVIANGFFFNSFIGDLRECCTECSTRLTKNRRRTADARTPHY